MTLSDPSTDPRPNRNIRLLESEGFSVDVASFAFSQPFDLNGNHFLIRSFGDSFVRKAGYFLERTGLLRERGAKWFDQQINLAVPRQGSPNFDVVIVEDLRLLKYVFDAPLATKVIFDAREFYPGQFPDTALYRMLRLNYAHKICADYLSRCDLVLTVSAGIAELYQRHYGPLALTVMRSIPREADPESGQRVGPVVRLVHHGNAAKIRKLENLVVAAGEFPSKYTLDLYLNRGGSKSRLARLARRFPNVTVLDPVPHTAIAETIGRYDVGLSVLPSTSHNHANALPNKFFEYVHAGLAVIASPGKDQRDLIEKFKFGFVTEGEGVASLIKLLASLTLEDILEARTNAESARKELCFEKESERLQSFLRSVS
ncbi:hypothetical protein N9I09_01050 [Pontimonas sp.]|nr:hypothetical protein [Pontimonas sp.]MDA8909489.1 hypothetical protein [Pontimonas sp.]